MTAFLQSNEKATPRQFRHLDFISQFSTDIQHVSGKDNVVADALSRVDEISTISFKSFFDYEKIAELQYKDEELKRYRQKKKSSLCLRKISFRSTTIWCDLSLGRPRPFIPHALRKAAFDHVHRLSHPGVKATAKLVAKSFVWPGMGRRSNFLQELYCLSKS